MSEAMLWLPVVVGLLVVVRLARGTAAQRAAAGIVALWIAAIGSVLTVALGAFAIVLAIVYWEKDRTEWPFSFYGLGMLFAFSGSIGLIACLVAISNLRRYRQEAQLRNR